MGGNIPDSGETEDDHVQEPLQKGDLGAEESPDLNSILHLCTEADGGGGRRDSVHYRQLDLRWQDQGLHQPSAPKACCVQAKCIFRPWFLLSGMTDECA